MSNIPTREEAWALLTEFNKTERTRKHALAVEAAMRYMARKMDGDENTWGIVGLIHDLDYEQFPDEHCRKTGQLLEERGWPAELIRAAVSHGWEVCIDVKPETDLEKVLYAVDELTGLITACVLVLPSKNISDLKLKSVKKKWKSKSFAAGVDREIIKRGADMLNLDRDDLITCVMAGMQEQASALCLAGESP
ncbi:HD domain-containing protein [Planctomycetota bacterium]